MIVTVTGPRVAVAVAANDTIVVHVGLHGLFENVAVTPEGNADVEKVTGTAVPVTRVAVIEDDGLVEPWTTARLAGAGVDRLKSNAAGATVTILEIVLVCGVGVDESVTVNPTVSVPTVANEWVGFCKVDVVPSPKFHA